MIYVAVKSRRLCHVVLNLEHGDAHVHEDVLTSVRLVNQFTPSAPPTSTWSAPALSSYVSRTKNSKRFQGFLLFPRSYCRRELPPSETYRRNGSRAVLCRSAAAGAPLPAAGRTAPINLERTPTTTSSTVRYRRELPNMSTIQQYTSCLGSSLTETTHH